MIHLASEDSAHPGIVVVGVGGAGSEIVNRVAGTEMKRVDTIAVTTDAGSLERSEAGEKILVGREITGRKGCGGDSVLGRKAVLQDIDLVREALEEYDTVVLLAGLGGGTGTGALPEIASLAREMGKRALAVVTEPLPYEGKRRRETAKKGLASLRSSIDAVISIPNQSLLSSVEKEVSLADAFFEHVNGSICRAVRSLVRMLEGGGVINADFADIRSVLSANGRAAIGYGHGAGKRRAFNAASMALSSPVLEKAPFSDARAVLVSFEGSNGVAFHDVNKALKRIEESAHPGADIVLGAFVDGDMGDRCTATIIATGLGDRPPSEKLVEKKEEPVTWQAKKIEQTVIDFSPPERGRFADLKPSLYEGEDLDVPTILRRKAR